MKMIIACLFSMVPALVLASEISCYSGNARIYHGFGNDVIISDDFVSFTEYKTKYRKYINGTCVISD